MGRHILIACPRCGRSGLRIRPEYLGRSVQCKHCAHVFRTAEGGGPPRNPRDDPGEGVEGRLAAEVARLEGEREADRERLRESREEAERLRAGLEALREEAAEAGRRA